MTKEDYLVLCNDTAVPPTERISRLLRREVLGDEFLPVLAGIAERAMDRAGVDDPRSRGVLEPLRTGGLPHIADAYAAQMEAKALGLPTALAAEAAWAAASVAIAHDMVALWKERETTAAFDCADLAAATAVEEQRESEERQAQLFAIRLALMGS